MTNNTSLFTNIRQEVSLTVTIANNAWKCHIFAYPLSFLYLLISPLLFLLPAILYGFALTGGSQTSESLAVFGTTENFVLFITLGSVMFSFLIKIYWRASLGMRREEWTGTLYSIWTTPVSRITFISGISLWGFELALISAIIQLGCIVVLYQIGFNLLMLIPMFLTLVIASIAMVGIAIGLAGVSLWSKSVWRLLVFIDALLGIFTPVFFPIDMYSKLNLPNELQPVVWLMITISPTVWGVEAFRESALFGITPYFVQCIMTLVVLAVFWLIVGYLVYSLFETKVKRSGSLGKY